jgi:3-oxoacyl-[acyl-carrier protein] reductase
MTTTSPEPRIALVTGLSRRAGIAPAVVARLLDDGYRVLATGWAPHDAEMPWGEDADGGAKLAASLGDSDRLHWMAADLEDPATPAALVAATVERYGAIDAVVATHARSSHTNLDQVTVEELDKCWAINSRGSLLLAQALGQAFDPDRGHGRIVFFCSGQHLGPMGAEIAYAVSKGAIQQMTESVADELGERNITANCINPGPVDTGYATGDVHAAVARQFPSGRWGKPEDVANLVSFLVSPEGGWLTGQTLNSEGGFRRFHQFDPETRLES